VADNSRFVQPNDFWTARLAKYLPVEFLAPYTFLVGAADGHVGGAEVAVGFILLGVYIVSVVLMIIFRLSGDQRVKHLIVSPFAGFAFAYPIAAPLLGDIVNGFVVAICIVVAWALATFIIPKESGGFTDG